MKNVEQIFDVLSFQREFLIRLKLFLPVLKLSKIDVLFWNENSTYTYRFQPNI